MIIKLMLGVLQFKKKSFVEMAELFKQLGGGQNPDTLFITCSDSRVIPSLITQAIPGDLFVTRNIGNIIPPFPSQSSEAGAIEYALNTFQIKDIIICGHSQCGAMMGLLAPDTATRLPAVASWLGHSKEVLKRMHADGSEHAADPHLKLATATQKNIILQMEHLKTYPLIAQKLARKELTIHGWLYEFESGTIFVHEPTENKFISFDQALQLAIQARKNRIVTAEAMDFLEGLTHPKTAQEYRLLMQLFKSLKNDITPIWGRIKDKSQQKLWQELSGFYESPRDSKFRDLLLSGSQLKLVDLQKFKKNIVESEGYRHYCKQVLQPVFFSPPIPKERPSPGSPTPMLISKL